VAKATPDPLQHPARVLTVKVAGYSYDEIAAQLEVSWRTVNRQLVRAGAPRARPTG